MIDLLVASGGVTVIHPREKENFSKRMVQELWPYFDIYSWHAHGTLEQYAKRQELLEEWVRQSGKDPRKIRTCNTETGQRGFYSRRGEKEQAVTLVKKITYARSIENSEFHIWFTLQDYWDRDMKSDDSWGIDP